MALETNMRKLSLALASMIIVQHCKDGPSKSTVTQVGHIESKGSQRSIGGGGGGGAVLTQRRSGGVSKMVKSWQLRDSRCHWASPAHHVKHQTEFSMNYIIANQLPTADENET